MATWNVINRTDIFPDRFDAEYHSKPFIDNVAYLKGLGSITTLGTLFKSIQRGGQPKYSPKGTVKVLRSANVGFMTFNDTRQEYVTQESFNKSIRGQVKTNDVLITSTGVGTLGRTSIWYDKTNAFCDGHITILRNTNVNPYFITVYLNSKYGLLQFAQNYRGSSGQIEIYPYDLSKFVIPTFLFKYQEEIGNYLIESFKQQEKSHTLYHQAEALLTKELQLDKLQLPKNKWYTAQYSEVVDDGRMDSEYFSPVVKKILEADFLKGSFTIGGLFYIVRGYTPKSYYTMGVPMVKTKSVRTPVIDKKRIEDYANSNESLTLTQENDLILAAMGVGSLGRTSFITQDDSGVAIDGTLRIFRKKDENLKYVEIPTMLFLSTEIGQKLIYRGIVGSTGIISVTDDYLAKIPVPMVDEPIRKKLTELVLKSIEAKKQSQALLARAKTRVEELIEQEANKK